MRRDPFAFFRGANPLFLASLPRAQRLLRAPRALVCGDLHPENFGTYKGDNRLCYFDINDFDDACLAPFTLDIVRFLTGLHLAARQLGVGRKAAAALARGFLAAYCGSIADGKPRWVERSLAQGEIRAVLRRSMRRTRRALLARLTERKAGRRLLRLGRTRALRVDARELLGLKRLLARERGALPGAGPRFFRLLDAARRIAGNGSLGLPRYSLLIEGRGPEQNFVLDLKFAAPSAVAAWLKRTQPKWRDDAARVVAIERTLQAVPPALLHPVSFAHRPFVLKELQPSIDRLDLMHLKGRPRRLAQVIEEMGRITAWAHLRGCARHGAAAAQTLESYVAELPWRRDALRLGEALAARTVRDFKAFARDYDAAPLI